MIFGICPICETEIEEDENNEEGNCPKCNAHYNIDFDCDDEYDAVLILDFDYYYMSSEEKKSITISKKP